MRRKYNALCLFSKVLDTVWLYRI